MIAVAHDIRSLHNVGAIVRTADGAGCRAVVVSGYTGDATDPRARKVSLGAEQAVELVRCADLDALLAILADCYVVLLEQDPRSVPVCDVATHLTDCAHELAIVVCEELCGAPPELRDRADLIVEIPMRGTKESLNVSVAFGIGAYAVAHADPALRRPPDAELRSRAPHRRVRDGVLTRGVTSGARLSDDR